LLLIVAGLFISGHDHLPGLNKELFWTGARVTGDTVTAISGFSLVIAITAAMVGTLFSSDAWYDITFASDEVVNPERNLPLSLVYGTVIVTFLYLLVNMVYVITLPVQGSPTGLSAAERGIQFATEDRVATAAMEGILGERAAWAMAILVMISTFGCNNGIILASARIYYAMAVDGLFFNGTGVLNSKGVPARALIVQGIWTSLLCLSGTYSNLLDYVVFTVLLFFILTISSVFIFRKRYPGRKRAFRVPFYPVLPALYITAVAFIMIILLIYKPLYTWPGLIIVLIGVPVYYLWRSRQMRA